MILKLLFPDSVQCSRLWYEMDDPKILDDEEINGYGCYHLLGTRRNPDDTEAWISKADLIVRRLKRRDLYHGEQSERHYAMAMESLKKMGMSAEHFPKPAPSKYCHEYNYNQVTANQPLPDELFNFEPS